MIPPDLCIGCDQPKSECTCIQRDPPPRLTPTERAKRHELPHHRKMSIKQLISSSESLLHAYELTGHETELLEAALLRLLLAVDMTEL